MLTVVTGVPLPTRGAWCDAKRAPSAAPASAAWRACTAAPVWTSSPRAPAGDAAAAPTVRTRVSTWPRRRHARMRARLKPREVGREEQALHDDEEDDALDGLRKDVLRADGRRETPAGERSVEHRARTSREHALHAARAFHSVAAPMPLRACGAAIEGGMSVSNAARCERTNEQSQRAASEARPGRTS